MSTFSIVEALDVIEHVSLGFVTRPIGLACRTLRHASASTARDAVATVEFARDRLRNVLPRLHERLRKMEDAEYLATWRAQYEVLKEKRDALARELPDVYPPFVAKIADLLSRMLLPALMACGPPRLFVPRSNA